MFILALFRLVAPGGSFGCSSTRRDPPHRDPSVRTARLRRQQDTGFLDRTITLNGTVYHYAVYLPMDWTPKQKWPVILFLHGSGERGADGLDETQVVVMPQVPWGLSGALDVPPDRGRSGKAVCTAG